MKTALYSLIVLAISGCVSTPAGGDGAQAPASVCKITTSEDSYLGKTVRVSAIFNTDFRHFTYLQDASCDHGGQLNIGHVSGNAEYENLRKSWLYACERRGSEGLCIVEEPVDVVGTIRQSDEGYLVLDVVNIRTPSIKGDGGN